MAIQSLSDVAEHNFRSLEEIERYLDSLKLSVNEYDALLDQYQKQFARDESTSAPIEFKINVKKGELTPLKRREGQHIVIQKYKNVRIPKIDRLRKNFGIVDDLYEKLDVLRNLESTVSLHFDKKTGAGKTLQGIRTLKKQVEQKVKVALNFLEKIGSKYEPSPFKDFIQKVADKLSDEIQFEDYSNYVYVHENAQGNLQFTHYLKLDGVKDEEDKQFPELYVVFTNLLTKVTGSKSVSSSYYVNVLYEFQTPGKFEIGTAVDSVKGALLVIGSVLELELNFSSQLGVLPLNLDDKKITKEAFSAKKFISSVSIDERSIEFTFVKDVKTSSQAEEIASRLYLEVKALLSHIRAKMKVRVNKELGRYKAIFTLSNLAGPGQVSVDDVKPLMERLGVDEEKMKRIVRIINGG